VPDVLANAIALSIVAIAAVYMSWKWMPTSVRRRFAAKWARHAQRKSGPISRQVARVELRLSDAACGACETCGGCASKRRDPR